MESKQVPLDKRSEIQVSNLVSGNLRYDKDSNMTIKSIQFFMEGIEEPIGEVQPTEEEFGASFSYIMGNRARAGTYTAVWNTEISDKPAKIASTFVVNDDIDRTIPIELQHLS